VLLAAALKPEQNGYYYNEYSYRSYQSIYDVVQFVFGIELITDGNFTMFGLALAVVITKVSDCFISLTHEKICAIPVATARTLVLLLCFVLSIKKKKCILLCAILISDAP
jgi:hypothetical protein